MEWDWNQALFWGGVGTGLGAALGVGIYGGWWAGAQFGWWGSTATSGVVAARLSSAVEVAQPKVDYLLGNSAKASGFARLGYTVQNSRALHTLLTSIGSQITSANQLAVTQYGTKFEKAVEVIGPSGVAGRLVTIWQIDHGTETVRLITAWAEVFK